MNYSLSSKKCKNYTVILKIYIAAYKKQSSHCVFEQCYSHYYEIIIAAATPKIKCHRCCISL